MAQLFHGFGERVPGFKTRGDIDGGLGAALPLAGNPPGQGDLGEKKKEGSHGQIFPQFLPVLAARQDVDDLISAARPQRRRIAVEKRKGFVGQWFDHAFGGVGHHRKRQGAFGRQQVLQPGPGGLGQGHLIQARNHRLLKSRQRARRSADDFHLPRLLVRPHRRKNPHTALVHITLILWQIRHQTFRWNLLPRDLLRFPRKSAFRRPSILTENHPDRNHLASL